MENLFQLHSQLGVNKNVLHFLTLNIDKFYYKKVKAKMKFGKPQEGKNNTIKLRHLSPPVQRLKLIQNRVCNHLQKIDLPNCMYGAVAESNNVLNALQHIENKFFFTIDLKDFFSRINNKQVHYTFIENGYCWEAARVLTKLTTYKYSLPQGAPTSPVIANLAFKQTALQLMEVIKGYDITFTTFLDDLAFSSKKDFNQLQTSILETIRKNSFFPHPKKIHYCENICDITGLFVGNGKLKIHPKMFEAAKTNYKVKKYLAYVMNCYIEYQLVKLA